MEVLTRTRSVGGSLIVTIPKQLVEALNLKENEQVQIEVKKTRKGFFGKYKGIGPFTKKDRLDTRW